MSYSLPGKELLQRQAEWLAEARARLLRLAGIGRRRRILDLGAGYGEISSELQRRSNGRVFSLDRSRDALRSAVTHIPAICADVARLPFPDAAFDLVFSQNVLLWMHSTMDVANQVFRVLHPGGVWVLFEPDYGGMIEYPLESGTRDLWIAALQRLGADPFAGRKLPGLLTKAGFQLRVELLPRLHPPDPARFDFLLELPLTSGERQRIEEIRSKTSSRDIAHLPYFLILAERF